MPWASFVFLMGHMLVSHIYRELYSKPGVVDVTGAQMVLVMKVCRLVALLRGYADAGGAVDGILLVSP